MINILSYVGMNMQSEVCLWTLLGLMRTIFDATLFKVNANLKQVWQMSMPAEMSMPVQRVLRTMISGIMLVQCFTVYVYLASYIVLLYPVFLEERPTLVLPWLLLAAIRKLLCELTSLAMGLGACVLLGPAKPPCIKFLVFKIASIMPSFYKWILIYSYYNALKVATAYKTFPIVLPPAGLDYGLELAVRRRCTKSLFGEEQLRKKLEAGFYGEGPSINIKITPQSNIGNTSRNASGSDVGNDEPPQNRDIFRPLSTASHKLPDVGAYEDWFGSEIMVPRDGDRILEQFVVMLLRIAAYLKNDGIESINSQMFNSALTATWATRENIEAMPADITDTPPLVGNMGHTASYLRNYPQIFMKKLGTEAPQTDRKMIQTKNAEATTIKSRFRTLSSKSNKSYNSNEMTSLQSKRIVSDTIINFSSKSSASQELQVNPIIKEEGTIQRILSKHEYIDTLSLVENLVEDAAIVIKESFDKFLHESQNVSNIANQKFLKETENQLEIKHSSKIQVLSEDFILQNVEEVIEGCSKYINDATEMIQSKIEQVISVEKRESSKDIDPDELPATSNVASKVLENTNYQNGEIDDSDGTSGLTNTYLIANIVLNALDTKRNTDANQLIVANKKETDSNLKSDVISNEVLEPEKEEIIKISSKLSENTSKISLKSTTERIKKHVKEDKSSTDLGQLPATSSVENKLLENTSTIENKANDNNSTGISRLTSVNITENIALNVTNNIKNTNSNQSLGKIQSSVVRNETVLPKKKEIIQSCSKFTDEIIQSRSQVKSSESSNNIDPSLISNNAVSELLDDNNNIKERKYINSANDSSLGAIKFKEKVSTNASDNLKSTDSDLLLNANDVKGIVMDVSNKEIVDIDSVDTSGSANTSPMENKTPDTPNDKKI